MTEYTPEEQANNRRLWIEALQSNKYQQNIGQLRKGDKYCCLGVACDISELGIWEVEDPDSATYVYRIGNEESWDIHLPLPVADWLGLSSISGFFYLADIPETLIDDTRLTELLFPSILHSDLTKLNDKGATFHEIAQLIADSETSGALQKYNNEVVI